MDDMSILFNLFKHKVMKKNEFEKVVLGFFYRDLGFLSHVVLNHPNLFPSIDKPTLEVLSNFSLRLSFPNVVFIIRHILVPIFSRTDVKMCVLDFMLVKDFERLETLYDIVISLQDNFNYNLLSKV